jgi:hypothetical protein
MAEYDDEVELVVFMEPEEKKKFEDCGTFFVHQNRRRS